MPISRVYVAQRMLCVLNLPIYWYGGKCYTAQSADRKLHEKGDGKKHGCRKADRAHIVAVQLKILTPVGTAISILAAENISSTA